MKRVTSARFFARLRKEMTLPSKRSKAILKVALKPIIEALKHDGNRLEHHARKLRTISPNLEAEAEEIDDMVASIRQQNEIP
jgi:predicted  nucleic acid-binding Zn-ribbon protein